MPVKKRNKSQWKYVVIVGGLAAFGLSPWADFNPKWKEPGMIKSENGVLETTLESKKVMTTIGGKQIESMVYNGNYPGTTWEIKGGDRVKVSLKNRLDQSTNLHFHGGHVSPKGNSDNVLLNIKEGEDFSYEYNLPTNHPPGLYWYHPHLHLYTEEQVMGGMAGAIIVRGDVDELPGIKGVPERLLVLTTQNGPNNSTVRLVNGELSPMMYLRPGQTVRMRVVNASADDFYNLSIPGHKLHIFSRDGNTMSRVQSVDSEVLSPGDRVEFMFTPKRWGEIEVKSLVFNAGFFTYPDDTFMKIKVAGLPTIPTSLPKTLPTYDDFSTSKIDNVRTLTFTEGGTNDNPTYLLDGKVFDPNDINQVMVLGTTEEWRLVNKSGEIHPFHIHINPFQVISVNGKKVDRPGYDDTFPIPANGEVTIKTRYDDFDGKYVLHCHILFHEDHGMMQVVEVVKPGVAPASDNGIPLREGMPGSRMMMGGKNSDWYRGRE